MKIIELSLNYDEIRKRIEIDKARYKVKKWSELTGTSRNVISNIHGKAGKHNPSLQYIIAVARATGKPVEWYLYGEVQRFPALIEEPHMPYQVLDPDDPRFWPEDVKNICKKVKKIIESKSPFFVLALQVVVATFEQYIYSGREKRASIKQINDMISQCLIEPE